MMRHLSPVLIMLTLLALLAVLSVKRRGGECPACPPSDASIGKAPLVEREITVYGLTYDAKKKRWVNGKVYNPQDGRTYSCWCALKKQGTRLYFRGFIGMNLLGGSQTWTREKCGKGKR